MRGTGSQVCRCLLLYAFEHYLFLTIPADKFGIHWLVLFCIVYTVYPDTRKRGKNA